MSKRLLGDACKSVAIERGIVGGTPCEPPAYIVCCHMQFESINAFLAAWGLHGETLGGAAQLHSRPNYTDVQPVIQFSEPLRFA